MKSNEITSYKDFLSLTPEKRAELTSVIPKYEVPT